jgi:large subunit ribosomal protein L10
MPSQQVLQQKTSEVESIAQLMKQHKVVAIVGLQKVRASQLQEFKRNLADKVYMKVMKNTLIRKAIEKNDEPPGLKKLLEYLAGSNVFLFTDLNPFKLALILEKGKVRTTAKSGDIAAFDVVIPAGNTGQAPGPIISQLNSAGLPTRIEAGSVWVSKDTLVARKGDVINDRLASVLSKLGIKPVEAGLSVKVALDEGLIITHEQLRVDVDGTKQSLEKAQTDAFALAIGVAFPTMETTVVLLQMAHHEAYALSLNAAAPTKETIGDLIRMAHMQMLSLSSRVPSSEEKATVSEKAEKG